MHEFFDCIYGTGPSTVGETACPICLEETSPDTVTITHILCRKTFCRECLEKWVAQQPCGELALCPMDRQIIGVGESGAGAGDDGSYGNDEEEEEGGEEPYDVDDEDEAWNLHPPTPDPIDASLVAAVQAEAREAEDHMWNALIFEDFSRITDTMTDDSSGLLRPPSTPEGAAPRRRDTI
jgi:hypothetical protein